MFANRLRKRYSLSRSKFAGAHGDWMKAMAQFQAQVPHPLVNHLPEVLATSGARTPTIRILFLVFIAEDGLEGSPMQVEGKDIAEVNASCGKAV